MAMFKSLHMTLKKKQHELNNYVARVILTNKDEGNCNKWNLYWGLSNQIYLLFGQAFVKYFR